VIQFTRSASSSPQNPPLAKVLGITSELDYVRLRQLSELLEQLLMRIEGARFEPNTHPGSGRQFVARRPVLLLRSSRQPPIL
jgi:hypothetical protein